MPLKIKVIRSADPDLHIGKTWEIGGEPLSFGRGADNDIKLTDPERSISRHHATLAPESGGYRLLDFSSNGTFVNGAVIGGGKSVPLGDRDQFDVGPYGFEVELDTDDISLRGLDLSANQYGGDARGRREFDSLMPAHAASQPGVAPLSENDPLDFSPPGAKRPGPELLGGDVFDGGSGAAAADAPRGQVVTQPHPDRGIGEAMKLPVRDTPAQPHQTTAPEIPSDFSLTEWPAADGPVVAPEPPTPAAVRASQPIPDEEFEPPPPPSPPLRPRLAREPAPLASHAQSAESPRPSAAGADDVAALLVFLRGAGLSPDNATLGETPLEQLERAGQIFRGVIEGVLDLLRTRNETKNALRMSRTLIADSGNNPLKLAPNVDEALVQLLGGPRPGYLTAEDAVREAFDDQRNHEVAFLAGIREAFPALIEYLDPQAFARGRGQATEASVFRGGPLVRSRAWQEYVAWFDSEVARLDDGLPPVWRERLVDVYERVTATARHRNQRPNRRDRR